MILPRRLLTNPIIKRRWYTPLGSHVADNDPLVIAREKERLLRGKKRNLKFLNNGIIQYLLFHQR